MIIPDIWEIKKCSKPPTSHIHGCCDMLWHIEWIHHPKQTWKLASRYCVRWVAPCRSILLVQGRVFGARAAWGHKFNLGYLILCELGNQVEINKTGRRLKKTKASQNCCCNMLQYCILSLKNLGNTTMYHVGQVSIRVMGPIDIGHHFYQQVKPGSLLRTMLPTKWLPWILEALWS